MLACIWRMCVRAYVNACVRADVYVILSEFICMVCRICKNMNVIFMFFYFIVSSVYRQSLQHYNQDSYLTVSQCSEDAYR